MLGGAANGANVVRRVSMEMLSDADPTAAAPAQRPPASQKRAMLRNAGKGSSNLRQGAMESKRMTMFGLGDFRQREATRDETPDLEKFNVPKVVEESFRVLPSEVFRVLTDLRDAARDVNTEVSTPEFVVIGQAGHGKSSAVEAILGWPLLHVDLETATKRPVHIAVQLNAACVDPRFTLLADPVLGIRKRVSYTSLRDARTELEQRLRRSTELVKTPLHLLVEHSDAVNMNIIECPGLNPFGLRDATVLLASEIARPTHRTLIVVEECGEWKSLNQVVMQTLLHLDPDFSRTIFVNSKLNSLLQGIYNADDLSQYLVGMDRMRCGSSTSFYMTSLSSGNVFL